MVILHQHRLDTVAVRQFPQVFYGAVQPGFLLSGKMYAIFALLFGLSFFIQSDNQAQRGNDFSLRFAWRMVLLFIIGLVNAAIYNGDVLTYYAVFGLLMIPIGKLPNRWVWVIAALLFIQPLELYQHFSGHTLSLRGIEGMETLYPTLATGTFAQSARASLPRLVKRHGVEHIAIGNGTASRETEQMTVELIHKVGGGLSYMIVSEAGASVYSASKLAAEEFPQFDVNLRSAVSIARRLQDPLAELVKIDPKAIGVGQYQHDMPQKELDASLNAVVEDCVNAVGVDLNTASPSLLTRVAGLNGTIAKNIVAFREENGVFTTRRQLLKVAKLGPKAFEQCAGFLRVPESKNVLDNTGVHPESYDAAKWLLELLGATPKDARDLPARLNAYGAEKAAEALGVGVPTLRDIAKELSKPGRDPRDELPAPILRTDVLDIKDLKPGMVLTGTVRNVIDFGVFVDIGVHQDGLVHISQVCNKFIKHPSEAVAVGDVVKVVVLDVDEKKHRISLSMKQVPEE